METLGINMYDANGNFVGMQALAGQLTTGLGGLTQQQRDQAMATIFGSDAVRAANVLYMQGADGVGKWTREVNDSGYAAKQAALLTDNLKGDVERLGGAFDTALIQSGSAANDTLRFLVQAATGAVDVFSSMPGPVQGAATGLLGVAGAGTVALGAIGSLIPRVGEAREALRGLGTVGGKLDAGKAAGAGVALGALWAILEAADPTLEATKANIDDLQQSLIRFGQSGDISGEMMKVFGANISGVLDDLNAHEPNLSWMDQLAYSAGIEDSAGNLRSFGEALHALAIEGSRNADNLGVGFRQAQQNITDLDTSIAGLVQSGHAEAAAQAAMRLFDAWTSSGGEIAAFRDKFPGAIEAMENFSTTSTTVVDGAGNITTGLGEAKSASDLLKASFDSLNGIALTSAQANIAWTQTLADLKIAADNGSTSLDINTSAGADNAAQFVDAATKARDFAAAVGDTSGPEAGRAKLEELRGALVNQAVQTGFSRDAVSGLIDTILQVPADTTTAAHLNDLATPGLTAVNSFLDRTNGRVATVTVNSVTNEIVNRILNNQSSTYRGEAPSGGNLVGLPKLGGAIGGVLNAYASGGFEPMRGGIAQVVGPNTWRVIGDRVTDDEAYIPINDDRRSQDILSITAARMGYGLVKAFAGGGYVKAEDGTFVPTEFYVNRLGPGTTIYLKAEDGGFVPSSFYGDVRDVISQGLIKGMTLAEDGSWVPDSFYDGITDAVTDGLKGLKDAIGQSDASNPFSNYTNLTDAVKPSDAANPFSNFTDLTPGGSSGWAGGKLPYGWNVGDVDQYGGVVPEGYTRDKYGSLVPIGWMGTGQQYISKEEASAISMKSREISGASMSGGSGSAQTGGGQGVSVVGMQNNGPVTITDTDAMVAKANRQAQMAAARFGS
jgi:hypothetical protein